MKAPLICASLLSADAARLGDEAQAALDGGADWLHFDVMDHHYVDNLTFGPMVCASLRRYGIKGFMDVHLMVEPVEPLMRKFADAGADLISFHPEICEDPAALLDLGRQLGVKVGLVVKPEFQLDLMDGLWEGIDLLLLMSVEPGHGGQAFMPSVLPKLREARRILDGMGGDAPVLEVDGGINPQTAPQVVQAGASALVAGSAVFSTGASSAEAIARLRASMQR